MKTGKLKQICKPNDCDKKPFTVKVGETIHKICCEKGFNKLMDDFKKYINHKTTTHD
jgi:hypothetical protein